MHKKRVALISASSVVTPGRSLAIQKEDSVWLAIIISTRAKNSPNNGDSASGRPGAGVSVELCGRHVRPQSTLDIEERTLNNDLHRAASHLGNCGFRKG